ncbi:DUF6265 family protein [Paraglaciecola mesophila]|uniref:DUF6265 family protein n=1 Tax=Paraglaciecola mesophila TaxID=197222 RepID=UPI0020C7CB7D|nr:DUF6265 family protein [Paraglaciecola mesophila]
MIKKSLLCLLMLVCFNVLAEGKFPNLMFLDDKQQSPRANLTAVNWLTGHWRGEAFGGLVEEVWSPPYGWQHDGRI